MDTQYATRSIPRPDPRAAALVTIGAIAAVVGVVALPAALPARMMLLVPLIVVPMLVRALPGRVAGRMDSYALSLPALAAALFLVAAFAFPPGPIAFGLALPWLAVGGTTIALALAHGVPRLPWILHPRHWADLTADAALAFLGVGAVFVAFDRVGFQPLGLTAQIVLLTAVHFHVAGFGLVGLGSILAKRGGTAATLGAVGVTFGIPLTSLGWTVGLPAINALGSVVVGLSGLGVALALVRVAGLPARVRRLSIVAGAALLVGLPLGAAWGVASWLGIGFIDIDLMARIHGSLNLTGVVLATFALASDRSTSTDGGRPA
jgi:hypothetical protein